MTKAGRVGPGLGGKKVIAVRPGLVEGERATTPALPADPTLAPGAEEEVELDDQEEGKIAGVGA